MSRQQNVKHFVQISVCELILAPWRHMVSCLLFSDAGSVKRMLSDGTKPLHEPMLADDQ